MYALAPSLIKEVTVFMENMKQTIHSFTEFMRVIFNNQDLKEPNCCEDCKKIYYGNKCPICGKDNEVEK